MGAFTLPEEILGVPLWIPDAHNYFEVEDDSMPNGDPALVVRGDLSTDYKAFIRAPVLSPRNIFYTSEVEVGREWAMSCWLFLPTQLAATPAVPGAQMLGCSAYASGSMLSSGRNTAWPLILANTTVDDFALSKEPLNNIASPQSAQIVRVNGSFRTFYGYWFLLVFNMVYNSVTPAVEGRVFADTYNNALWSDTAGGSASSGSYILNKFLHIGAYNNGGVGRAGLWKIGKWAFHDHQLTIAERLAMWQGMYGAGAKVYTDDFNRASAGFDWQNLPSNSAFTIVSNQAVATGATFRNNAYAKDLGSPNMYCQVQRIQTGYWGMPTVRQGPIAGSSSYYSGGWSNFNLRWEINRGGTLLASTTAGGAPSHPYTERLEVTTNLSGNVELNLYVNGVLKLSFTDSSASKLLVDSNAGMYLYGSAATSTIVDNFECGTL